MIQNITSVDDVKLFLIELKKEDLNFHPDTPFEEYVNIGSQEPTYTKEETIVRGRLLHEAFDVCEEYRIDIYELSTETFTDQNMNK